PTRSARSVSIETIRMFGLRDGRVHSHAAARAATTRTATAAGRTLRTSGIVPRCRCPALNGTRACRQSDECRLARVRMRHAALDGVTFLAWVPSDGPEDFVLLDFPKALVSRQSTVDREPLVRVSEVGQVEPAGAGQRHPRVADDEILFRPAALGAVANVDVEGLATPVREHGDRVV